MMTLEKVMSEKPEVPYMAYKASNTAAKLQGPIR